MHGKRGNGANSGRDAGVKTSIKLLINFKYINQRYEVCTRQTFVFAVTQFD